MDVVYVTAVGALIALTLALIKGCSLLERKS